ncbi:sodium stibogluconate resistance protein, putative [Leishmania tarentolae]|uniref:Sodium stibogluconate resistance protein, putative n=1 Tax=Leishmania tarentolae TaxID=5689 RepID=A0A640L217_LEITA|nr:sodium stibogluconate resistance protein, putative [Leishmania tarentolae]
MGNSQSSVPVEGEGHPDVFYRGVTAARDGRYTVSEVYFVQALTEHPGRSFWETLTSAVLLKERRAGLEGGGASLPKDGVQEEADAGASVDAPSGGRSDAPPKTVLGGGVTDNAPALATGENTQLGAGGTSWRAAVTGAMAAALQSRRMRLGTVRSPCTIPRSWTSSCRLTRT